MSQEFEITVLSVEDLRTNRKPVSKNAFVVVTIDPFNIRTTKPDETGGSYPTWNEKMQMDMPTNGTVRYVSIEAFRQISSGNAKKIGTARIPVTDFMGGYAPEGYLHFMSYRLRDDSGDRNGIINVSVRLKVDERNRPKKVPSADAGTCFSQAMVMSASSTAYGGGGIATGIPVVWYGYQTSG